MKPDLSLFSMKTLYQLGLFFFFWRWRDNFRYDIYVFNNFFVTNDINIIQFSDTMTM